MSGFCLYFSPDYYADIGENHVFPIKMFELARDILLNECTIDASEIHKPKPAEISDLQLIHSEDYRARLINGELTKSEVRRLGLPWSESFVRRSLLAVSETINASKSA